MDNSLQELTRRGQVLKQAINLLGVREDTSLMSNVIIKDFYNAIDNKTIPLDAFSDDTPWCSAFIAHVLSAAGIAHKGDSLLARSWLKVQSPEIGPVFTDLDLARPSDLVILWTGSKDNGVNGHIGLYLGSQTGSGDQVYLLSGNSSNKVGIALYPKGKILGIRHIS